MSTLGERLRRARARGRLVAPARAETLERIGRAIYEGGRRQIHQVGNQKTSGPWEGLGSETRWTWIAAAKAAIEELENLGWSRPPDPEPEPPTENS